jgi:hypothetical protein
MIICHGYPPWFRKTVTNVANVEFDFPSLLDGNLRRGGWILVVGLGDLKPLPYFSRLFGEFEDYQGRHHRGGKDLYWSACRYFQDVINTRFLISTFPNDKELLDAAHKVVEDAVKNHNGSITSSIVHGTPLKGATRDGMYAAWLEKSDVEFTINIFNHRGKLTIEEVERLQPMLRAVLAVVVRGIHHVFSYLNDSSFQLHRNIETLVESNSDVYIEQTCLN